MGEVEGGRVGAARKGAGAGAGMSVADEQGDGDPARKGSRVGAMASATWLGHGGRYSSGWRRIRWRLGVFLEKNKSGPSDYI